MEGTIDGRGRRPHDNGLVLDEDVDLIVKRWIMLRESAAWVGATREEMEALFREVAPEEGSPPLEVMERTANEVMRYAGRIDHPRLFAFVPFIPDLAHAVGGHAGVRIQRVPGDLARVCRSESDRARRPLLVP